MASASAPAAEPAPPGVQIVRVEARVFDVSGETYALRDLLASPNPLFAAPGRWVRDRRAWRITVADAVAEPEAALRTLVDERRARLAAERHAVCSKRSRRAAETRRLKARRWTDAELAAIEVNFTLYEGLVRAPLQNVWTRESTCFLCHAALFACADPRPEYYTREIFGCWHCGKSFVD